jgi:hypothetical protein
LGCPINVVVRHTLLLWEYSAAVPIFFLAGLSLKVLKCKPLLSTWAKEDEVTTRALPSGDVLAVEINNGSSSFVKKK